MSTSTKKPILIDDVPEEPTTQEPELIELDLDSNEEEDSIETPNDVTERFEKLNQLLKKTETYSQFLGNQLEVPIVKGKTIQTIALLAHLYENGIKGIFLVVAPLSTLGNWMNEFAKFVPKFNVLQYHGNKEERAQQRRQFKSKTLNVIVTSYDICIRDKLYLKKLKFKYCIVDEAHRLKNFDCKLVKHLKQFNAENRLLLTGTPLQNKLSELWSLLNFLLPELFDDLSMFESWFNFAHDVKDASRVEKEKQNLVAKLHEILRPFLLRRLKSDVNLNIPQKKEYILYVPMPPKQKTFYDLVKNREFDNLKTRNLMNIIMQLRKACNHPFLFQDEIISDWDRQVLELSGKMMFLNRVLPMLQENNHHVLIFSQMTSMLDIIQDYLEANNHSFCRIDGTTKQQDREKEIEKFNVEKSFVFLLSTRAGGLGINLVSADTVIIFDSDWNPQVDLQAQDRCHRIGQNRAVRVFRLITVDSVEKKILNVATQKLNLERLVIQQGQFHGSHEKEPSKDVALEILTSTGDNSPYEGLISDEDLFTLVTKREIDMKCGVGYEMFNEKTSDGFSLI